MRAAQRVTTLFYYLSYLILFQINHVNSSLECPLVLAAENGQLDAVGVLLQCEWPNPGTATMTGTASRRHHENKRPRPTRNKALQQALVVSSMNGHRHVCKFLLGLTKHAGEGFDINNTDSLRGETGTVEPLYKETDKVYICIFRCLLYHE